MITLLGRLGVTHLLNPKETLRTLALCPQTPLGSDPVTERKPRMGRAAAKERSINIFEQCCPKHSWVMWRERKQRDVAGVSCCRLYSVGGFIMFSPLVLYVPSLVSSNKLLTCLAVFVSISS